MLNQEGLLFWKPIRHPESHDRTVARRSEQIVLCVHVYFSQSHVQ